MVGQRGSAHIGSRVDLRVEIAAGLHPRVEARHMRTVGAWAVRNKYALWETFYGSTRPPR